MVLENLRSIDRMEAGVEEDIASRGWRQTEYGWAVCVLPDVDLWKCRRWNETI